MGMAASQARLLMLTARLSDLELEAQMLSNAKIRLSVQSEGISTTYSAALNNKRFVEETDNKTPVNANVLTGYGADAMNLTEAQMILKTSAGKVIVSQKVGDAYSAAKGSFETFLNSFGLTSIKPPLVDPGDTPIDPPPKYTYDEGQMTYYQNIYNEIGSKGSQVESDANLNSYSWLHDQLTSGNISIEKYDTTANKNKGGFVDISWNSNQSDINEVYDTTDDAPATATFESEMSKINTTEKMIDLKLKNIDTEHTALQTEYDSVKKVIDKNIERTFKIFNA